MKRRANQFTNVCATHDRVQLEYSSLLVHLIHSRSRSRSRSRSIPFRYGFNGKETDGEIAGNGNAYDFGARTYDARLGRWWSVDAKLRLLPTEAPYDFAVNNPIWAIDIGGYFPILINGNTSADSERASTTYWDGFLLGAITEVTGYHRGGDLIGTADGFSRFSGDMMFVDGNRGSHGCCSNRDKDGGMLASDRRRAGVATAKMDADLIWQKLKESIDEDGKITETIQIISHSRGGAFANGYVESLKLELLARSKAEAIGFAYDNGLIVDLVIMLAPHQSNSIEVSNSSATTVSISHTTDILSGDDASGSVLNLVTNNNGEGGVLESHKNYTFAKELKSILRQFKKNMESNSSGYKDMDKVLDNQVNATYGSD